MKLYWWNGLPNLGDLLTKWLLEKQGESIDWAPPREAEWVGIGSVLEFFDGFQGTVFGAGRGGPSSPPTNLRGANVLALRGKKTRQLALAFGDIVLGDPGLLIGDYFLHRGQSGVVIVPHWSDQDRMRELYPTARFVDVKADPTQAIQAIADSERVIASSLHGIVLADALGKPRMWDWFDGTQGRGFKFADYGTVVGAFEPGEWQEPDVNHTKKELRECLKSALESSLTTSSTISS